MFALSIMPFNFRIPSVESMVFILVLETILVIYLFDATENLHPLSIYIELR